MRERVLEIISKIIKIDRISLEERIDDKEIWDSLHRVEALFAIEDEFGIQFSESALVELDTPRKLCLAVEKEV